MDMNGFRVDEIRTEYGVVVGIDGGINWDHFIFYSNKDARMWYNGRFGKMLSPNDRFIYPIRDTGLWCFGLHH